MNHRATPQPSRPRCLAASLALHALLLAGAGVVASFLPPRLAPEAGAGGITVRVVFQADEAPDPPTPTPSPTDPTPDALAVPAPPTEDTPTASPAAPTAATLAVPTTPAENSPAASPPARSERPERLPKTTAPTLAAPSRPAPGGGANAGAYAAPSPVHCPAPAYPASARRAGREGTVRLRLVISPSGRVAEAVIVESSGQRDFDEAAQRTILREWRYAPARRGGIAVTAEETVRIEFRLRSS